MAKYAADGHDGLSPLHICTKAVTTNEAGCGRSPTAARAHKHEHDLCLCLRLSSITKREAAHLHTGLVQEVDGLWPHAHSCAYTEMVAWPCNLSATRSKIQHTCTQAMSSKETSCGRTPTAARTPRKQHGMTPRHRRGLPTYACAEGSSEEVKQRVVLLLAFPRGRSPRPDRFTTSLTLRIRHEPEEEGCRGTEAVAFHDTMAPQWAA